MAPIAYSMWSEDDYDSPDLLINCLLPNGVLIPLRVHKTDSMKTIKHDLWLEARKYPLFDKLGDESSFIFMCINEMAVKVELLDENRRLSDVRPFQPLLKLIANRKPPTDQVFNAQINVLLGKVINDSDFVRDSQVIDFRHHMREMCERIARDRDSQQWLERAMSLFPPDVVTDPDLPEHLLARLEDSGAGGDKILYVQTRIDDKTNVVPRTRNSGRPAEDASLYALKVSGRQEYLLGNYRLSQFVCIRRMIRTGVLPELAVVSRETILTGKPPVPSHLPRVTLDRPPAPLATPREEENRLIKSGHCLYDLQQRFSLTLHSVSNVNIDNNNTAVCVRMCLYHGGEILCNIVNSSQETLSNNTASWSNGLRAFDLDLQNIPRMARLCLMLYSVPLDKKGGTRKGAGAAAGVAPGAAAVKKYNKKDVVPLAWVNLPVFDYKGVLRAGDQELYMWSITDDDILTEELLNPIGTVESNPLTEEAVCLKLSFGNYNLDGPIYYPPFSKVLEVAAQHANFGSTSSTDDICAKFGSLVMDKSKVKPSHLEMLRLMIDRDPLDVLDEQDKEVIWTLRYECREHFPRSLPKLLGCVHWDNYVDNCLALLQIWIPLPPTEALELLDCQYSDKAVRKFAVICLKDMSDTEICQYLLQFVQVLKYESYLECDLIEFLLQRALNNKKIGHHLFWLLRSEMHIPSVSVRFSLILEAYCRGSSPEHLTELNSQVEALSCLRLLNEHIKNCSSGMTKLQLKEEVQKRLSNQYKQSMTSLTSPLDPCLKLKTIKVDQCQSMMSKMRPLWLVWENADEYGELNYFIYKKGDDLRQDMLSLQILRIMDNIWQADGIDLRLNAYGCQSTGHAEGLIEIVTKAKTLANIQKMEAGFKVKSGFNKQCLYQWLKRKNTTEKELSSAVSEFMMSCAGYCVATYVLGVADRHSDNIMLRENGQLFHIDFGHILGHFKSKLGVKRERVPFVLTTDFVYVINHGPRKETQNFDSFRTLCERAFMALRRRSRFLMTLFMMMMNTGIPEVSCIKDIEYLRETLVPHFNEQEAIEHFRAKFREALANSWKTNINWWIHNLHTDNS